MKKEDGNNTFLLIIVIILVILIYVGSFGQVNITKSDKLYVREDHLSKLKRRHSKLKELIARKEELNRRLNRKFKWIYFGVRFGLASIYLLYNFMLYLVFNIQDIGAILNWNEVALICLSIFSFLTFGTFTNLSKFIDDIKMKLEIRIYAKYENLGQEIGLHKNEENLLTQTISTKESLIIEEKKKEVS